MVVTKANSLVKLNIDNNSVEKVKRFKYLVKKYDFEGRDVLSLKMSKHRLKRIGKQIKLTKTTHNLKVSLKKNNIISECSNP